MRLDLGFRKVGERKGACCRKINTCRSDYIRERETHTHRERDREREKSCLKKLMSF